MTKTAAVALAQVMAHCGGNPAEAARYLAVAIAEAPTDPEPYAMLADLRRTVPEVDLVLRDGGSVVIVAAHAYVAFLKGEMNAAVMCLGEVVGHRPHVAWADSPWFSDPAFLHSVSADVVAEAVLRIVDGGHDLDTDELRDRFRPWLHAIAVVAERDPRPEAMARMAMFLRACGLTDASLALCDQADSHEPIVLTEVVRAGTWRWIGDSSQTAAAFERAIGLDPGNWSLYLDLADVRAEQGDFAAAAALADQGLAHGDEVVLRAARAAYRARLSGSATDLTDLIELVPLLASDEYRRHLIDQACAGPGLAAELIAAAQRAR